MTTLIMTDSDLQREVLNELNWEPSVNPVHIGVFGEGRHRDYHPGSLVNVLGRLRELAGRIANAGLLVTAGASPEPGAGARAH